VNQLRVSFEKIRDDCLVGELQRGSPGQPWLQSVWRTSYLHTNNVFIDQFPGLSQKLRNAILEIDQSDWKVATKFDKESLNWRTVEFHEYSPGGQLSQKLHFDSGSIVTIDVMLAEPGTDFEGGDFTTPEPDGSRKHHSFKKGDAVLFLSHKYHNVMPVTKGKRAVLVAELWTGPNRVCPHRCWEREGDCDRKLGDIPKKNPMQAAAENALLLG